MHCTNKNGVKYFVDQLIQFIIISMLYGTLPTKCHEITFFCNNISVFLYPRMKYKNKACGTFSCDVFVGNSPEKCSMFNMKFNTKFILLYSKVLVQYNSIQFLFKVNTFGNVTNYISFKLLLHRLNFENTYTTK